VNAGSGGTSRVSWKVTSFSKTASSSHRSPKSHLVKRASLLEVHPRQTGARDATALEKSAPRDLGRLELRSLGVAIEDHQPRKTR